MKPKVEQASCALPLLHDGFVKSNLPVFPQQSRDPSEFGDVVRNECQPLSKSNCRYFKVVRTDALSDTLEGIANLGVVTCG